MSDKKTVQSKRAFLLVKLFIIILFNLVLAGFSSKLAKEGFSHYSTKSIQVFKSEIEVSVLPDRRKL